MCTYHAYIATNPKCLSAVQKPRIMRFMNNTCVIPLATVRNTEDPEVAHMGRHGTIRLEKRDNGKNIARYYRMAVTPNLFGEWTLQREWGRIGQGGKLRLDLFATAAEAMRALHRLKAVKLNRCYVATDMGHRGAVAR